MTFMPFSDSAQSFIQGIGQCPRTGKKDSKRSICSLYSRYNREKVKRIWRKKFIQFKSEK
jgi:hypothetical protein